MPESTEHEIQKNILLKLIHAPELGFNELWAKQGESNAFAYHIKKLEEQKIIQKTPQEKYQLTTEGRKLSAFIEGDTGTKALFPTITVVLLVWDGDKLLCQKRLKEPFYGTWGFVSGKINFGFNLFECATRDLKEETDLEASDWTLKALEQIKTYEQNQMIFHHYLFMVETKNAKGILKERTHKAEHAWLTVEEYEAKKSFPGGWFYTHILPAKRPILIEAERFMEKGKFIGGKLLSVTEF